MTTSEKILVTGATGSIGSLLIENLTKVGANVRALVREESKGKGFKDASVEFAIGDLSRPETLDAAFAGVSRVYLLTPLNEEQYRLASSGLAAAKRSGKPHVVRSSGMIPAPIEESRVGRHQVQIENDLKSCGLPYTILRPHLFMQTTMIAAQTVKSEGTIYMPLKEGKIGMIDIRDIAEAAAKVLTSEGHEGKTYELTGPAAISIHDVAAALSKALGKPIRYVDVPPQAARESLLGMGVPEWVVGATLEFFQKFSEGGGDKVTGDFESLTGHAPRSYKTFAKDFVTVFGGSEETLTGNG